MYSVPSDCRQNSRSKSVNVPSPPNCGKTMLRAVALELGLGNTFEARPCPCGYHGSPIRACDCSCAKIERCRAAWPVADITIEVVQPPQREFNGRPGTGVAEMKAQIASMTGHTDLALDEHSANLLKCACAEYGIDPDSRNRIIAIARTIANLDRSERIGLRIPARPSITERSGGGDPG